MQSFQADERNGQVFVFQFIVMKTSISIYLINPFRRSSRSRGLHVGFSLALALLLVTSARATTLTASDGTWNDWFGGSVSSSGDQALIGARDGLQMGTYSGLAYYFKNLNGKSGNATEDVKLLASDGSGGDLFGNSVSLFGDQALIGANGDGDAGNSSGSAYYFKDLNAKSGIATQDVKLLASDGVAFDLFGFSVSLSGDKALVAAQYDDDSGTNSGSAYYFKELNGKSGTTTEDVKLLPSDGTAFGLFGLSVSLDDDQAVIGASDSAYYFKNLNTKSDTAAQDVKLLASDGAAGDSFGYSVSSSGDQALVGASGDDDMGNSSGSVYYFKDLNTKSGTVTQDVKLLASDGAAEDFFGESLSLSGDRALVGAGGDDDMGSVSGSAYYFKNLNGKGGTVTQDVKLLASDGAANSRFGNAVSISGDRFVIGAQGTRKAYAGDIRAFTTLDAGETDLETDGVSFVLSEDWVIGGTTDGNSVTLSRDASTGVADTADVTALDAAVFIGQAAGSDNNRLAIEGALTANAVHVGGAENSGNGLTIATTGEVVANEVFLAPDSFLAFELGASGVNGFIDAEEITLAGTLMLSANGEFVAVEGAVYQLFVFGTVSGVFAGIDDGGLLEAGYAWDLDRLYTDGIVSVIPEPSTYALFAGLAILAGVLLRRRGRNG